MAKTETKIWLGLDPHPGQQTVLNAPERFRVLDCGRRWGKTVVLRAEMLRGVQKGLRIAYCCPTEKMLKAMWRWAKQTLAPITLDKSEQEHRLELQGGASIDFWSLNNPDGPRGQEYDLLLFDEAAVIPTGDVWFEVLWPTLGFTQGKALFASTPKGYNWFWKLFELGDGPHRDPDWYSWKLPTTSNPFFPKAELENIRRHTPASIFSQEYEAEFISDASSVFRHIDDAAVAIEQKEAIPGHVYVFGVDLAKQDDFSVFLVFDVTTMSVAYIDVGRHVDYSLQKKRLVALAQKFRPVTIMIERNTNLSFVDEQLRDTNLPIRPFDTTGAHGGQVGSKGMIIENLAAAFDNNDVFHKSICILPDDTLLRQLKAYAAERLPSGQFRYAGPKDTHDDYVMALALAYHAATYDTPLWGPELVQMNEVAELTDSPAVLTFGEMLLTGALSEVEERTGWEVFTGGRG
jgi:hypothetical protein